MPRNKLSASEKLTILQEIEAGHIGVRAVVKKYCCAMSTLANWQRRYRLYGYEGLELRTCNHNYSEELKH